MSKPRQGAAPVRLWSGVASMNKEMIISASGHETMAAILEDDDVVEIFVELQN